MSFLPRLGSETVYLNTAEKAKEFIDKTPEFKINTVTDFCKPGETFPPSSGVIGVWASTYLAYRKFLESDKDVLIIFEDDITFGSETIQFFALALKSIKRMPNVLLVSGFQPFPSSPPSGHVVFTNYPQIWGWATFAEKWVEMRSNIFRMPLLEQQISLDIRNFWKVGWKRVQRGYLDTWDLPIATGMLFSNKLCMLPPVNLTSNIGVDSYSTNTQMESFPLGLKIEHIICEIISEGISTGPEIYKVNSRFEREIYNIGIKHVFSPALALFDRIRFAKKRKRTLKERMLSTTNL